MVVSLEAEIFSLFTFFSNGGFALVYFSLLSSYSTCNLFLMVPVFGRSFPLLSLIKLCRVGVSDVGSETRV